MNDFHILTICIQNKDVTGAMRELRDKSEFAVRKILEKLKVRVTSQTGRVFWHFVQGWLLTACRLGSIQHESVRTRCISQPAENRPTQPGSNGYDQARGASGHAHRSHQYAVSDASLAGDVCAWPDGLPPVHAYMGDERAAFARTSAGKGKPAVDLGSHHAAGIQPGLPGSPAVVGDEHPVRVRRRHAAACPAVPVWPEGKPCRWFASGAHDISASARKLWPVGRHTGRQPGNRYGKLCPRNEAQGRLCCRAVTALLKRYHASAQHACRDIITGHTANTGIPPDSNVPVHGPLPGRPSAFYAASFLLYGLYRPSAGSAHTGKGLVNLTPFPGSARSGFVAPTLQ